MSGLNRATLIGHLGADPELKFTQGGQAILRIRLATSFAEAQARYDAREPSELEVRKCPRCNGEGFELDENDDARTCTLCDGEGEVRS